MSWGEFFTGVGKDIVSTGAGAILDYQIADKAKSGGYGQVEGNMFSSVTPDSVTQSDQVNGLPNGKPITVFTKADGSLNMPIVAGALVLGALIIKKVA